MGAEFSQEIEKYAKQQEQERQQQEQAQAQAQSHPQPQQQQQPLSQERTGRGREAWVLPYQGEATPSTNSAKAVENTSAVKPSGTPSLKSVTPLKEVNLPHNHEDILKDADSPVNKSSKEKLRDQLYAGVFLSHKTKKYWLDKKSNANCFMLYARTLSITWGEDKRYWKWVPEKEASGTMTEVAELKQVCWLEVIGKFDTRKLSPGILYEVSFVVMFKESGDGWEFPVTVRLDLPGGKNQHHKENFDKKLRGRWIEIPVGDFVTTAQVDGEMKFFMLGYDSPNWKRGLVVKGVSIKPKI